MFYSNFGYCWRNGLSISQTSLWRSPPASTPHPCFKEKKEKDSEGNELRGQVFSTVPPTYFFPHLQYFRSLHPVWAAEIREQRDGRETPKLPEHEA